MRTAASAAAAAKIFVSSPPARRHRRRAVVVPSAARRAPPPTTDDDDARPRSPVSSAVSVAVSRRAAGASLGLAAVSSIALATATTGVVSPAPARADASLSLDGVIELTPENFARVVEAPSSGNVFVEFYAPWCPFCQRLEPIWSELPEKLRDAGVPTTIARMNVDTYTEYGEAFDVSGFPTLILFKDGVPIGQKTGLVDVQTAMRYAGVRDDGVVAKLSEKIPGGRVPPQMNLVVTSPQIDAAREELGALRKVVEGLPDERERAEAVARVKNLEGLFAKRSL